MKTLLTILCLLWLGACASETYLTASNEPIDGHAWRQGGGNIGHADAGGKGLKK